MSEGNSNIQVEIADPHEFHGFRLVLNPEGHEVGCPAPGLVEPCRCSHFTKGEGTRIEIMLHARSLVDLIHKCNLALCDWQSQTSAFLIDRLRTIAELETKR